MIRSQIGRSRDPLSSLKHGRIYFKTTHRKGSKGHRPNDRSNGDLEQTIQDLWRAQQSPRCSSGTKIPKKMTLCHLASWAAGSIHPCLNALSVGQPGDSFSAPALPAAYLHTCCFRTPNPCFVSVSFTNKCSLKVSLSSLPRERISLVSLGWAFNWLTNQKWAAAWIQGDGVMGMSLCGVAEVLCRDWKCSRCPEGQSPRPWS